MGESLGDLIATLGSIDDDEIDWQNVRQTTVLIQQSFAYEYPGPIASLRSRDASASWPAGIGTRDR